MEGFDPLRVCKTLNMKRIGIGSYTYKGYHIRNHGYYPPDKCIWWEAVNLETNDADFHAHTKKHIKKMIDESY